MGCVENNYNNRNIKTNSLLLKNNMKEQLKTPIRHMLQGLAHWMAYRYEMSNIQLIEADAVFVATDILRTILPNSYIVEREVTKKSLPIVKDKRIDLGIRSKIDGSYKCLIEFKLADATNEGYKGDAEKLSDIKLLDNSIDCLIVNLYRKPCLYSEPEELISENGNASKKKVKISNKVFVRVRCVCNSFTSSTNLKSIKTICIELI